VTERIGTYCINKLSDTYIEYRARMCTKMQIGIHGPHMICVIAIKLPGQDYWCRDLHVRGSAAEHILDSAKIGFPASCVSSYGDYPAVTTVPLLPTPLITSPPAQRNL
jgi:hypothetical protein